MTQGLFCCSYCSVSFVMLLIPLRFYWVIFSWAEGLWKTTSQSLRSGKVCVYSILSEPSLWDDTGYVVVFVVGSTLGVLKLYYLNIATNKQQHAQGFFLLCFHFRLSCGLFTFNASPVLNSPKIHCFWRIRHTPANTFWRVQAHRLLLLLFGLFFLSWGFMGNNSLSLRLG